MPLLPQKPITPLQMVGAAAVASGLALLLVSTVTLDLSSADRQDSYEGSTGNRGKGLFEEWSDDLGTASSSKLVSTEDPAADSLLPRGVTEADGRGGKGMHRAVLKNGVWIPLYSPGSALLGGGPLSEAPLTEVPLSITSGTPPAGKVGAVFAYDFEAIGGTPPYQWQFQLSEGRASFVMDPTSGLMSGTSGVALESLLEVFVTDSVGARDSAQYVLKIEEETPLTITTTTLPAASPGEAYATRLEATGGTAPYFWSVTGLDATGLVLTPNTGELTGMSETVGQYTFEITVTDQADASETLSLAFTVGDGTDEEEEEGTELRITTTTLPEGTVGTAYSAQLVGEGGEIPYTWSFTTALPDGLALDATTGAISGTPTTAGEYGLQAMLTDKEGEQATQSYRLRVPNGLDITNTSPLMAASPGLPYKVTFTATGGEAPYRWRVKEGALPSDGNGIPWRLSPDGVLTGVAPPTEALYRFTVEVEDSAARTFVETFDLPVRQALIAIASREKVGLAWRPDQIDASLRASGTALAALAVVRGVGGFPPTPAAGAMVYQGTGNNIVDRNLPTGATFFYSLFAQTTDGRVLPYATAAATILPVTLLRAQADVTGDPYADRVPLFQPLRTGGFGAAFVPANITGPPDGRGTLIPASLPTEVASLHAKVGAGGGVVLEFTNNIVDLGPGADFTVFENVFFVNGDANDRFMEPAVVWVALFDDQWYRFPIDVVPPADGQELKLNDPFYYNRGFAGRNPTTGSNPTNPDVSGGDAFDADSLFIPGLTWIRYIRIQSTGDNAWLDDFGREPVRHPPGPSGTALSGQGSSGFDLDAVSAVNY